MNIVERMIDSRAGFLDFHIAKTILLLNKNPIGRSKLIKELGINEASVRTLLKMLEKDRFVVSSSRGHELSKKGAVVAKSLTEKIKGPFDVNKTNLSISEYSVAYVVRGVSHKIKKGVEQRDQAIIAGADGLITIIKSDKLYMPGVNWNVPVEITVQFENLMKSKDVLLIGFSKTKKSAEFAALNAALLLLH
jgi:predicted transcriptional regulator